jgi:hypothetical protein
MYKLGIPLLPAEEIGYYLGLTVNPSRSFLFYKVRVADTPPAAGYGTQIYKPEYEPNAAFRNMGVPMHMIMKPIDSFVSADEFLDELKKIESEGKDTLMCFNHGALVDDETKTGGIWLFSIAS